MNLINGKVVVKETRAGIPDLLIVVYDADPRTIPEEAFDPGNAAMNLKVWPQIDGDRLGSVITDDQGKFELEYQDSEFQIQNRERRPDLVLFVVAPEDPSVAGFPRILHVSSGMRQNAGHLESYLIRLPIELLRKAGIVMPETIAPALEIERVAELVSRMRPTSEPNDGGLVAVKPFSQRYKEQHLKVINKLKGGVRQFRPAQSFDLPLPVKSTTGDDMIADGTVSFDNETGRLVIRDEPGTTTQPLQFTGVEYSLEEEDLVPGYAGTFLIDPVAKKFRLRLPKSPTKLTTPDSGPSELYKLYRKRFRTSSAATPTPELTGVALSDSTE